jgi:WD40 repeat protein
MASIEKGYAVGEFFKDKPGRYQTNSVPVRALVFAGNGQAFFTACPFGIEMTPFGLKPTNRQATIKTVAMDYLALAPDRKRLASASGDTLYVWLSPPTEAKTILRPAESNGRGVSGPGLIVTAIAWSSDGGTIAGGFSDGTIRLWNVRGAKQLAVLEEHKSPIVFVGYQGKARTLVSVDKAGSIKLWDTTSKKATAPVRTQLKTVASAALNADGRMLAIGSGADDGQIEILELSTTTATKPAAR